MGKIKLLLGASFLLLSSVSNAGIIEYSISGGVTFNYTDENETFQLDITGTAYIDDVNLNIENPDCFTYFVGCGMRYNITYFDMYVGGPYNNFTGSDGYINYSPSDFYGEFIGTGDWSSIYHSDECGGINPCTDIPIYEDWLAFELPDVIEWSVGYLCCAGIVNVNNPILENNAHLFAATLERVGPVSVPEPPAILLFVTGILGLFFARRKQNSGSSPITG